MKVVDFIQITHKSETVLNGLKRSENEHEDESQHKHPITSQQTGTLMFVRTM